MGYFTRKKEKKQKIEKLEKKLRAAIRKLQDAQRKEQTARHNRKGRVRKDSPENIAVDHAIAAKNEARVKVENIKTQLRDLKSKRLYDIKL